MLRIAIDGPGGAGKSTVARAVAAKLGIIYVDTGALYRTIGLYMLENSIDPKDQTAVSNALPDLKLEMRFVDGKQIILLNGNDVGDSIRTPQVSMAASDVSAIKQVRDYLLDAQRSIAAKNSVIMDGRDIGTVILPNAEVKIFLTASPEARARRRHQELLAKGHNITFEQVYSEMIERDKNDSTRDIAPCVCAEDAILLDNSDLDLDGTVDRVLQIVKKNKPKKHFYMKAHRILAPLIRFFQRIRVTGLENIPPEGAIMFCSNHMAAKDPILIGASCPRRITFIGKKELFKIPVLGFIIKKLGAVPLDRGGSDLGAIRTSVNVLKNGEALAIFPQGHRYPGVDPATTPTKKGAALIAYRSQCDVVPVYIKTKGFKYHFLGRVEIIFGKVIPYSSLGFQSGGSDEYDTATEIIFNEIVKLGRTDAKTADCEENKN